MISRSVSYRMLGTLCAIGCLMLCSRAETEEPDMQQTSRETAGAWQQRAADYARMMSQVRWTPVTDGMPNRSGGYFKKGTEYTGVPYSSVKSVGRYIGYDIFLKTFLAAVENPRSVLYTEDLSDTVPNAATYYGKVCSSFTSYALQCGIWYVSRLHGPEHRQGVEQVTPQSARNAQVGDIIYTPPAKPSGGSHVEIVTGITKDSNGTVTHVRVDESSPPTTKTTNRRARDFNAHLAARDKKLYRIADLNAWRGDNRAEAFLLPNYGEDSAIPVINRVLLLDRGDWVPYHRNQPVKINVMDRDAQGVSTLVIKRGDRVVEEMDVPDPGVIERSFSACGDYTAHCVMLDGTISQACEFSVCDLDFGVLPKEVIVGEAWDLAFRSENLDVAIAYVNSGVNSYAHHSIVVTEKDRRSGTVTIPAELIQQPGDWQVWLIGENRYGRLKKRCNIAAVERPAPQRR